MYNTTFLLEIGFWGFGLLGGDEIAGIPDEGLTFPVGDWKPKRSPCDVRSIGFIPADFFAETCWNILLFRVVVVVQNLRYLETCISVQCHREVRWKECLFCVFQTEKVFSIQLRFLDAPLHLYKRSCPSVRPSVRSLVCPFVCPVLFSHAY